MLLYFCGGKSQSSTSPMARAVIGLGHAEQDSWGPPGRWSY